MLERLRYLAVANLGLRWLVAHRDEKLLRLGDRVVRIDAALVPRTDRV